MDTPDLVRRFSELSRADIAVVGGKNASLGEMITTMQAAGMRVPAGFATTAAAYWSLLEVDGLAAAISAKLAQLEADARNLSAIGAAVREMVLAAELPAALAAAVTGAYREMAARNGRKVVSVAVRSSATAEDLPEASFAGQLETFLNVRGEQALLEACRRCYASLFTDRAIVYRRNHGFDHMKVAAADAVADTACASRRGAGHRDSREQHTEGALRARLRAPRCRPARSGRTGKCGVGVAALSRNLMPEAESHHGGIDMQVRHGRLAGDGLVLYNFFTRVRG